jgi:hypothetical protein
MSLKAFHMLFIALSAVLALGTAIWALDAALTRGGGSEMGLAILFAVFGVALIVYGLRVRRKFKTLGSL